MPCPRTLCPHTPCVQLRRERTAPCSSTQCEGLQQLFLRTFFFYQSSLLLTVLQHFIFLPSSIRRGCERHAAAAVAEPVTDSSAFASSMIPPPPVLLSSCLILVFGLRLQTGILQVVTATVEAAPASWGYELFFFLLCFDFFWGAARRVGTLSSSHWGHFL